MTSTSSIQATSTASVGAYQGATNYGNNSLDKDAFLRLLTVQLQHQDPLNPMDNSEFVAQLSQFSSLEQLTTANDSLNSMALGMSAMGSASMVNLIGKEVRATGDTFYHDGGSETLHFGVSGYADEVAITISDSDGNIVAQQDVGATAEGDHTFNWNGLDQDGNAVAPGNYQFSVSARAEGVDVASATYIQGVVNTIDYSSGTAQPTVDGQAVTVDRIVQVITSTSDE